MKSHTLEDAICHLAQRREEKKKTKRWGDWTLEPNSMTLTHLPSEYTIELDLARTPAEMLDWIFQIRGKVWMSPEAMADFLGAIDDILAPQERLCSWGQAFNISDADMDLIQSEWGGKEPRTKEIRIQ